MGSAGRTDSAAASRLRGSRDPSIRLLGSNGSCRSAPLNGNLRVAQPSTAAQYFHLLRAQVHRSPRSPLIVITPKSLLRARESRSGLTELTTGAFAEVIDDPTSPDPAWVRRIVLCSGKISHEAMRRRDLLVAGTVSPGSEPRAPVGGAGTALDPSSIAVVRVEQLYPWPEKAIQQVFDHYPAVDEVIWLQEEPENMGAWSFVHARLHRLLRDRYRLRHVSREESASPATGSAALHQVEQADLLVRAIG